MTNTTAIKAWTELFEASTGLVVANDVTTYDEPYLMEWAFEDLQTVGLRDGCTADMIKWAIGQDTIDDTVAEIGTDEALDVMEALELVDHNGETTLQDTIADMMGLALNADNIVEFLTGRYDLSDNVLWVSEGDDFDTQAGNAIMNIANDMGYKFSWEDDEDDRDPVVDALIDWVNDTMQDMLNTDSDEYDDDEYDSLVAKAVQAQIQAQNALDELVQYEMKQRGIDEDEDGTLAEALYEMILNRS